MRRAINIILSLVIVFTCACTKVDNGSVPPVSESDFPYIFFDAMVAQTKSNLLTGSSLPTAEKTSFGVYGNDGTKLVFENVKMYRPDAGASFIYDELVLWEDNTYDFYAYYPYNDSNSNSNVEVVLGDDSPVPYISYTQPTSLDKMVDVMTASAIGKTPSSNPVPLTFNHRLFALDVVLVNAQKSDDNTDNTDNTLNISKVELKLSNLISSAKLYFDGTISPVGTEYNYSEYSYDNQNNIEIKSGDNAYDINGEGSFLLLPCESFYFSITIEGTDEWGSFTYSTEKKVTCDGGFLAGKQYQLSITKKAENGFIVKLPVKWEDGEIGFTFQ